MFCYIAFLRGINLGKRRVKMEQLRGLFEAMKFTAVETFIASGNVLFTAKSADAGMLGRRIEVHLEKSLGYAVDTFVRSRAEVAAIAAARPFAAADFNHPGHTIHVGFLREKLTPEQTLKLSKCHTDVDEFRVIGREYYWLCRIKTNESKVWTLPQLREIRMPSSSMRNLTTLRKLAALAPPTRD